MTTSCINMIIHECMENENYLGYLIAMTFIKRRFRVREFLDATCLLKYAISKFFSCPMVNRI